MGALVVLGGIGALVGHASGHVTPKAAVTATQAPKAKAARPKATVKPQPVSTVTVTTTAPPPAATQPAAPPADSILAKFYGTGSGDTGTFTVPSDGNWHLSWAYANGTLFAGQAENFIVDEYGTDQPTAVPVYSDQLAGSQAYFQVITDDAHWELVVVSGPAYGPAPQSLSNQPGHSPGRRRAPAPVRPQSPGPAGTLNSSSFTRRPAARSRPSRAAQALVAVTAAELRCRPHR